MFTLLWPWSKICLQPGDPEMCTGEQKHHEPTMLNDLQKVRHNKFTPIAVTVSSDFCYGVVVKRNGERAKRGEEKETENNLMESHFKKI